MIERFSDSVIQRLKMGIKIKKKDNIKNVSNRLLDEFVEGCRKVAVHGLVRCSSGNLSWRIGADRMLIKSSRAWLGEMTRE